VTAELERRWEAALRELQQAEEKARAEQQQPALPEALSPEEREAFLQAGKSIPELWRQGRLSPRQKKAFLRCLIDKVVVHRSAPDTLQVRIVWRGGDTTSKTVPVTVGSLTRLSFADDMEREILVLSKEEKSDEDIATLLTKKGYRSTKHDSVLPSTVRLVRLRHRLFRKRSQSHPRHIAGYLTIPQLADRLHLKPGWLYHQIHNGTIQVVRDAETKLYLFPDQPKTMTLFKQLLAGKIENLRF
jgi:hypothetical protein